MLSLKWTERGDWPFSCLFRHKVEAFPPEPAEVEVLHVVDADETEESSLHGPFLLSALSVRRWSKREMEFAASAIIVLS